MFISLLFVLQGVNLDWQSYKLMPYVLRLSESVTNYQEKVPVSIDFIIPIYLNRLQQV